jgi:hypothetical protein
VGIFWIFGGTGQIPDGGGRDFLHTCHSLDEARAWLDAHPQSWSEIWIWRDDRLHFEEEYPPVEVKTKKGKKGDG